MTKEEADVINNSSPEANLIQLGTKLRVALNLYTGKAFFLDPVNGNDGNDGLSTDKPVQSLSFGYSLLRDGFNDSLIIMGVASAIVLTAPFVWAKNFAHLIGLAPQMTFSGRTRIGHAGTAMSPMFIITGTGCEFKNIHFQHGQASATNLIAVDINGLRTKFEGCHFDASLDTVASGGSYAWRAVQIESGIQGTEFDNCTFGSWTTAWASANGKLVYFMGDNADTYFNNCDFITNMTVTTMIPIDFAGPISGGQSAVTFKTCHFSNRNNTPAVIFGKPSNGWIELIRCTYTNATAWATTNSNLLLMNGTAQNAVAGGKAIAQS